MSFAFQAILERHEPEQVTEGLRHTPFELAVRKDAIPERHVGYRHVHSCYKILCASTGMLPCACAIFYPMIFLIALPLSFDASNLPKLTK